MTTSAQPYFETSPRGSGGARHAEGIAPRRPAPSILEAALAPADAIRRRLLRAFGPIAGRLAGDREARVAVIGVSVMLTSLVTTIVAPLWMLALGPILFGVPHLLADVRYLWVRPGLHKRLAAWVAIGGPLLAGLFTGRLVAGLLAAAGATLIARATLARRLAGLGAVGLLLVAAHFARGLGDLLFAHLHNVIAVALWWAWRPRTRKLHFLPLAAFVLFSVALMLGVADSLVSVQPVGHGAPPLRYHAAVLAPGVGSMIATRLVLLFCFAQSVHYGVWLRMVPEEDRPRPTPRPFAATARQLLAELGPVALASCALGCVALAVWAVVDLGAARGGYLRFATFHGQLELAAAALMIVQGRSFAAPSKSTSLA